MASRGTMRESDPPRSWPQITQLIDGIWERVICESMGSAETNLWCALILESVVRRGVFF